MPHAIVEWTANLDHEFDIADLLNLIARKLRASDGILPLGGIRVRAIRLTDYVIADGAEDDAFVNISLKIGAGRPPEFKRLFFGELFEEVTKFFHSIQERRFLALSMYVEEFDEQASYKKNNLHARFRKVD